MMHISKKIFVNNDLHTYSILVLQCAYHHMLSPDLTLVHDSYYPTNALVQLQSLQRIQNVNNSK